MKADFVRDLEGWRGDAKLYRLSEPYEHDRGSCDYVIVSAVIADSGPETYIFPSDAKGKPTSWGELPGSFKGSLDHGAAIAGFLESKKAAS